MPLLVILVFDVGKTNKKILLFNKQYEIVYEETVQLPEAIDEDGFPCEDVQLLTSWIQHSFQKLIINPRFQIVAVNVSAYGASFVHVDENLAPCLPLYNYLKPFPSKLSNDFYNFYDKNKTLNIETSSPKLGNLNSGLQLYWLKRTNPNQYQRICYSLHLPQYISSILSKKAYTEITSLGCHTLLWSFYKINYQNWVDEEKVTEKFPPLVASTAVTYINKNIAVGVGLHDSSAALIPYLTSFKKPFVLISTGTWCISINPFDTTPLSNEDLEQDCLCYLSYKGKPVMASRLFSGNEHEQQIKRLAEHFQTSVEYYKTVHFTVSFCKEFIKKHTSIKTKNNDFNVSTLSFAQNALYQFTSYEEAYHQLMMELVEQQIQSTQWIMKNDVIETIFVDGGFSKNEVYMSLLSLAFPNIKVFAATVAQASASGAAIAIHGAWNDLPLPENLITIKQYPSHIS